jgi:hypothetical protein
MVDDDRLNRIKLALRIYHEAYIRLKPNYRTILLSTFLKGISLTMIAYGLLALLKLSIGCV